MSKTLSAYFWYAWQDEYGWHPLLNHILLFKKKLQNHLSGLYSAACKKKWFLLAELFIYLKVLLLFPLTDLINLWQANVVSLYLWEILHCVKSVRIRSHSGSYFPAFGLNTESYSVSLRIQSECGKIRTRITPNKDTFHAVLWFQISSRVEERKYGSKWPEWEKHYEVHY